MGFGIDALVGWLPDDSGRDAMALAARFAASGEVTTRACTVLPQSWPVPSMAKVDAEYQRWLTEHGVAAVRAAENEMHRLGLRTGDPASFYVSNTAESAGLGEAAKQYDADIIVLGSAPGRQDRHVPGSTTDSLLHSSAVPLALAPVGTRNAVAPVGTRNAVAPIERITCAYVGTSQSDDALSTATILAAAWSVPLRLVAFAPRSSTTFPPLAGYRAEDVVSTRWTEQANGILAGALAALAVSHPHVRTESVVGVGNGWPAAVHSIPFTGADLLVVGSSRLGPIARVFLGSSASKIIRHAPVPTVVVPRGSSLHGIVTTMEEQ